MSLSDQRDFARMLPLSRAAVDRDYLTRTRDGALDELRSDPGTLVLVLAEGKALVDGRPSGSVGLRFVSPAEVPVDAFSVYLGRVIGGELEGRHVLAAVLDRSAAERIEPSPEGWGDLIAIGAELPPLDAGLFTQALAIANWHASHGFSPRTGEPTVPGSSGWVRYPAGEHDERSGGHVFPRTDPAVIVSVLDDEDRILLGANARWGTGRYSVLAGFVEPGESFEATVVREVYEESGITVTDPLYLGSQPWPFPASVMIGFEARVAPGTDTTPRPDGVEIVDLRWFRRDELADGARDFGIPGRTSIARALIERWYGGRLDAP